MRSIATIHFAFILFLTLFMLGCSSPYHGSIELQASPDYTGKSFAVAPPRKAVVAQKQMEYNDKTFDLKTNWDSLQVQSDSIVAQMYSRYYGHELSQTPGDSLWNACLNWEQGGLVPVWSRRNDLDARQDSFWLYMPALVPEQCSKIDKDFLVIPGVPMIYPVGFATAGLKITVRSVSAFLMTGNGVWDNRNNQWMRISAQQDSVTIRKDDPEADIIHRVRYSTQGMPEGKQWKPYYDGVLNKRNKGLEFYLSGGFASPHLAGFEDMALDSGMTFKAMYFSLGTRYVFGQWGIEAQWSAQATAYSDNVKTSSSYEEDNVVDEWALHTRKYQVGVVYYPIRSPLIDGLGFVALSGGLGYEQIKEWHPVSEYLSNSPPSDKPSNMGSVYFKPSFGYKSISLVSIDTPLELSLGADGIIFQAAIQFSLGLHL